MTGQAQADHPCPLSIQPLAQCTQIDDDIVGILYAKDLLEHWEGSEAREHLTAVEVSRKPFFVPETKKISEDIITEVRQNLAVRARYLAAGAASDVT